MKHTQTFNGTTFREMLIQKAFYRVKKNQNAHISRMMIGVTAALLFTCTLGAQTPFMIASVSSGQVLDVTGLSTKPGTLIQQFPFNFGMNQQWNFRRVPNTLNYEIVSINSGQVLDVPNLSTQPGTLVQQFSPTGGINQQWHLYRKAGATGYGIASANIEPVPGSLIGVTLVLDIPGSSTTAGTKIQQWGENDGTNQQWLLYPLISRNITLGQQPGGIEITGWGFTPNSGVCAFLRGNVAYNGPCATVLANGTFSAAFNSALFVGSALGYVVVTIEDSGGNVLAIGSLPGGFYNP